MKGEIPPSSSSGDSGDSGDGGVLSGDPGIPGGDASGDLDDRCETTAGIGDASGVDKLEDSGVGRWEDFSEGIGDKSGVNWGVAICKDSGVRR